MPNTENTRSYLEITHLGTNAQGKEVVIGKYVPAQEMITARNKAKSEINTPFIQTTREVTPNQLIPETDIPRINLNQGALRTKKSVQQITPELQTTPLSHSPKPVPSNLEWNLKPISKPFTGKNYQ